MTIITSLLDTDLYKLTQMQFAFHQCDNRDAMYKFKCRNKKDLSIILKGLNKELDALCKLKFKKNEITYLRSLGYFEDDYLYFLKDFKLNREHIKVMPITKTDIDITIKGKWHQTILFEVPVLAIVNELYFKENPHKGFICDGSYSTFQVSVGKTDMKFADFGTRRRYSKEYHKEVIKKYKDSKNFIGTSNVYFAKKYKLMPIGTQAHEYFCAFQVLTGNLKDCQTVALQAWADEYRGDLGIALSDTLGFDVFLRDFDKYFAKLYDGVRHDSGDPFKWCNKLIKHYKKLGINPKEKIAVFSDGLDFNSALSLYSEFKDKIKVSFGIGTKLTNGFVKEPLQIVIKLVSIDNKPVAKISDSPGKTMCEDEKYINYLKKVFKI